MTVCDTKQFGEARSSLWRSRWAALGAAVAVSLGAGGLMVAQAAPGPTESTIVAVTPERILDTGDPNNIGLNGPFVSGVAQKLQVTGSIPTATGTKTVVPAGATGVLLNVTPVGPTAAAFISIRPGDASGAATTSSLNFVAGAISPNSVQVAMPTAGANAGKIDITFDAYGVVGPTTDILIDVVGYTTNTGLQELVADVALKASTAALNAGLATKADSNQLPIARSVLEGDVIPDPNGSTIVLASVTIDAPVAGLVQLTGNVRIFGDTTGQYTCLLSTGAGSTTDVGSTYRRLVINDTSGPRFCATSGFRAVAAGVHVFNLVGSTPAGGDYDDTTLNALFVPGGTGVITLAEELADEIEKVEE
jgi:hypothetical protein